MGTSPIYKSATLYELALFALYGRNYESRYRDMAGLISAGSSVVDLCCGPAKLYRRYLRQKSIEYTGLDISPKFAGRLKRYGATGEVWDLREDRPLPRADYVIMQASLYHFLPDVEPIVDRMMAAAKRRVIISETVRSVASSKLRMIAGMAQLLTDPGVGKQVHRFTEERLDDFFSRYRVKPSGSLYIAGGREKVFLFDIQQ